MKLGDLRTIIFDSSISVYCDDLPMKRFYPIASTVETGEYKSCDGELLFEKYGECKVTSIYSEDYGISVDIDNINE